MGSSAWRLRCERCFGPRAGEPTLEAGRCASHFSSNWSLAAHVDLARESANEWLVRNKPYSRVEIRVSAMNAGAETARHLETTTGSALLVIDRTTWIDAAPITTVQAVAHPGYQSAAQS